MVVLYHAEAELDRALTVTTIAALIVLAIVAIPIFVGADPTERRNRAAAALLTLALAGIAAHLALQGFSEDDDRPVVWFLWLLTVAAFLLAPVAALVVFVRRKDRLSAAALIASLVLPARAAAWFVACGVSDACFH